MNPSAPRQPKPASTGRAPGQPVPGRKPHWARWAAAAALAAGLAFLVRQQAKKRPAPLPGLGGVATSIAYAPDGTLVCASSNNMAQKWMPENGKWRSFQPHTGSGYVSYGARPGFSKLRFSPDGKSFFTGGGTGMEFNAWTPTGVIQWDSTSRRYQHSLGQVNRQAFDVSADGKTTALGIGNRVWICPLGQEANFVNEPDENREYLQKKQSISAMQPIDLALSPDGKYLVLAQPANFDIRYSLYDAKSGRLLRQMAKPTSTLASSAPVEAASIAWSPDGAWIVATEEGQVILWDSQGEPRGQAPIGPAVQGLSPTDFRDFRVGRQSRALAFSPDSKSLAVGGADVRLFSVPALEQVRVLDGAGGVAFSPDGRTLATGHLTQSAVLEWHL